MRKTQNKKSSGAKSAMKMGKKMAGKKPGKALSKMSAKFSIASKKKSAGLVKSLKGILGKRASKSTSEVKAKAGKKAGLKSLVARKSVSPVKAGPKANSQMKKIPSVKRAGGRDVSASTKPSLGKIDISDLQRSPVEERLAPQSDKPYTGADAFKPEAKGADLLASAPPRKQIRQSRNQVGLRHH